MNYCLLVANSDFSMATVYGPFHDREEAGAVVPNLAEELSSGLGKLVKVADHQWHRDGLDYIVKDLNLP